MSITVTSNFEPKTTPEAKAEAQPEVQTSAVVEETTETSEASEPSGATEGDEDAAKDGGDLGDDDESGDEQKPDAEKPKKKNGFKKRVDKLNQRLSEREREVEYWKAEALKRQAPDQETKPKTETKAASNEPKEEDFNSHAEWQAAHIDWKVEQKLKEREEKANQAKLKTEFEGKKETYKAKAIEFAKTHTDFDEVLEDVADVRIPFYVEDAIIEAGPELAYELAKNPEELERICSLSYGAAERAIGRILARLESSSSEAKKQEPKTSKAPAPIKPLNAGSSASIHKSIYDESLPFEEYEKLRRKQMKERRA